MENTVEQTSYPEAQKQLIDMRMNTVIQVILLSIIVGAVTWLLTLLIDRYAISALVCGAGNGTCDNSTGIAGNIALVLTAIGGLLGLVKLGVYRPLLVVIAASIVLWGISGYVIGLQWYESLAWVVALYSLVYTAFAWLVRPRLFLIAIIAVLVLVIAARIIPVL